MSKRKSNNDRPRYNNATNPPAKPDVTASERLRSVRLACEYVAGRRTLWDMVSAMAAPVEAPPENTDEEDIW